MTIADIFSLFFPLFILFCPIIFIVSSIIRGVYLDKIAKNQNFKYSFLCYIPLIQPIVVMNIPKEEDFVIFQFRIRKKNIIIGCIVAAFMWQILLFPILFFPRVAIICLPIIFGIINYQITRDLLDLYIKEDNHRRAFIAQIIPFYKTFIYAKCVKIIEGKISMELNTQEIKNDIKKEKPKRKFTFNKDKYSIDNDSSDKRYEL